ncbi:MAG: hypothetical protein HYT22_01410 [Candidatus Niyogibacteria bacterium]|nr:hypothetical protein [Candidatus Niyogibacteria bacterium]
MWKRTLVLGIIIIGVGAAALFWQRFLRSRSVEPVVRTNGQAAGSQELLTLLGSLEGLTFDTSFFDDRLYKSLQDFSPEIQVPQTRGSQNPFVAPSGR